MRVETPIPGLALGLLAGGRSERMGRDKALLAIGGETLVERLCARLAELAADRFLAKGSQARVLTVPEQWTAVEDEAEGQGPMAGLCAVARTLPERVERLFACAIDLPCVGPRFVRALVARHAGEAVLAPQVGGKPQLLCAVYTRAALDELARSFARGERRLCAAVDALEPRILGEEEASELGLRAFVNVNTPEDWEAARRSLAGN